MSIGSANAGMYGKSGDLALFTGDVTVKRRASSSSDDSGSINISTGTSNYGFGGDIKLVSGDGFGDLTSDKGGGSIILHAGSTTGFANQAGSVDIRAGEGHRTSGDVSIHTPKSSFRDSGNIVIRTGVYFLLRIPSSSTSSAFV